MRPLEANSIKFIESIEKNTKCPWHDIDLHAQEREVGGTIESYVLIS